MSSYTSFLRAIHIYGGLPIFASGILGNLLNIGCLWSTRHIPCGFIFIVLSLIDCFVLFYGLFTRILSVGFNIDWSNTNTIWCKTRVPFSEAASLISLTLMCLASLDRMLSSCRQAKLRKLSRLSLATWSVLIAIIFWSCHSIPNMIYTHLIFNITTGVTSCLIVRPPAFSFYQLYFQLPIFLAILPNVILIITGLITLYNTKKLQLHRQRQRIQRQLTVMMLIQIPIVVLTTLPFGLSVEYQILTMNTVKSINQRLIENAISNTVALLFYIGFTCQFYSFAFSSAMFREQLKRLLLCRRMNLVGENST